jgi:hypothetical protein
MYVVVKKAIRKIGHVHAFRRDEYERKAFLNKRDNSVPSPGPTTLCHVFNLVKVHYDVECRVSLRQFQNNWT